MNPATMAELIEMPFGMSAWVSPHNHVLDGGPKGRGNFGRKQFWGWAYMGMPVVGTYQDAIWHVGSGEPK